VGPVTAASFGRGNLFLRARRSLRKISTECSMASNAPPEVHRTRLIRLSRTGIATAVLAAAGFTVAALAPSSWAQDVTCVSSMPVHEVPCPGSQEGPECPDSQNWQVCGDECQQQPDDNAWFCDVEIATSCAGCFPDSQESIFRANPVGSCMCQEES
jgi:hypothetical protein